VYPQFKISGQQLCNSDRALPLQFRFFNVVNMERVLIAQCTTSLQGMTDKRNIDLLLNDMPAGLLVIELLDTLEKP
jgi:hypothetical protein